MISTINRFRASVNARIWYELRRRDIQIPFPIRELHMHEAPDMEEQRHEKAVRKAYDLFSRVEIFAGLDDAIVYSRLFQPIGQVKTGKAASRDKNICFLQSFSAANGAKGDTLLNAVTRPQGYSRKSLGKLLDAWS